MATNFRQSKRAVDVTTTRGETVKLSIGTWIGLISLVLVLLGGIVSVYGRLVSLEVGVQAMSQTMGKVEARVERLEAK